MQFTDFCCGTVPADSASRRGSWARCCLPGGASLRKNAARSGAKPRCRRATASWRMLGCCFRLEPSYLLPVTTALSTHYSSWAGRRESGERCRSAAATGTGTKFSTDFCRQFRLILRHGQIYPRTPVVQPCVLEYAPRRFILEECFKVKVLPVLGILHKVILNLGINGTT